MDDLHYIQNVFLKEMMHGLKAWLILAQGNALDKNRLCMAACKASLIFIIS